MLVGVDILESLWAGGMGFSPSLMRHGHLVLREHADDAAVPLLCLLARWR